MPQSPKIPAELVNLATTGNSAAQFELAELERTISMLINEGFIRSYDQLINYLRKKWQEKYQPKVLQS